ncbi:hypothetical protein DFH07DRAFT_351099 [Mycena maculata]|uniref:DUF6534 domain-containing protein n=1 Tax=Mycena maculata TaxID=230809 RepID=A0AAD7JNQ8_9AGAR|nr:hypothetical protein DFH07DRAFT_351099 [Mycena maculata]
MATASLDTTMGIWLVSLFIAAILYGMGVIQAYLYFHWYPNDKWGLKVTVICLMVFETLQITLFLVGVYQPLIQHFGDLSAIFRITWVDATQLISGFLSAFLVQMYFAYCIYTLSPKYKIIPVFIVVLALLQIGSGLAQTITSTELGNFTLLDKTKTTTTLQAASTLACDVAITVCLCYTLNDKRTGVRTTNSLLNTLMVNAVNRGMLTTFAAAVNIVLFLSVPHTFWFFLGLIPSSKFYMNSMLATLNMRDHIRERHDDWKNSIPIASLSQSTIQRAPAGAPAMAPSSHFDVNGIFADDSRDRQDDGKKAFDMI